MNITKQQKLTIGLGLFLAFIGLYFLTYRGAPISGDELALFSTTESIVKYGEFKIYSSYFLYPGDPGNPWRTSVHEPLQFLIDIPLYYGALKSNWLGMLHTVWLSNIFITAAIGTLFYFIGLSLGYRARTAIFSAVIVGTTTMLYPFTQTHFREPLAGFFILTAYFFAIQLRKNWTWHYIAGVIIASFAAIFTKEAMYFALPSTMILAFPTTEQLKDQVLRHRLAIMGAITLFIFFILIFGAREIFGINRFGADDYLTRANRSSTDYLLTVIGAFFFSPGRSLWATSPILLLAIPGTFMMLKRGNWRLSIASWGFFILLTFGYGLGGWDWHGGFGWGTRYLLPVIPLMGLLILPTVEWFFSRDFKTVVVAGIAILSLLVQFGGLLVNPNVYFVTLANQFPQEGTDAFFDIGTWQIRYTQWYIHLSKIDLNNLPLGWRYANPPLVGIGVSLLTILLGVWLIRSQAIQKKMLWVALLPLIGIGFAMGTLREDKRMYADRPALHQALERLETVADEQDIIFLDTPEYKDFFMNFYRGSAKLVTLPYTFGERYSPNEPEPIVEDIDNDGRIDLNERIDGRINMATADAQMSNEDLWFLTDRGAYHTWAYRPVEYDMINAYYPVSITQFSDNVRLLHIYPRTTPYHVADIPEQEPHQFGEEIMLNRYHIQEEIERGNVLPISLVWSANATPALDYNVGVFLINEDGQLVAENNWAPQASFAPTNTWEPEENYIDNHGLLIPESLPTGDYTVEVVLYDWRDSTRLPVSKSGQSQEADSAILGTISVTD